uniref:Uncharacterized protein n=1 Tax=Chromera velia CCMP2878 TaxID=1169474 RepID=A0A0G4I887_9ALVE|eukprot:Cvel_11800.t1-p1 / transcript=Cvel_11800.t1 / gene=Cvel_11800 / organism=Chromera_velia_CCMP2878 / gene_product=Protein CbbY, putative / transcript_product=Protein CbbY, putative / location=Cvel_scaffold750:64033-67543(-) / protein_length=304 / sequence_SO=supercontig / SO=protein_coding / is_pseudo=false
MFGLFVFAVSFSLLGPVPVSGFLLPSRASPGLMDGDSYQGRSKQMGASLDSGLKPFSALSSGGGQEAGPFPILFDCDGVLADTEPDGHRVAFNEAFVKKGVETEWDVDLYGKLTEIGGGKERMTHHFNTIGWPHGLSDPEEKKAFVQELHLLKTSLFNDLISSGKVPLRPGVKELIETAFAAGCPMAVCSTSNEKAVNNLVKVLLGDDIHSRLPIFAGDVVKKKKPQPDIYLLAAEKLNLDPKRCVVVEDSKIGLEAAKEAGMKCLVTRSTYTRDEDFSGADLVVSDLEEGGVTVDVLRELSSR